MLSLFSSVNVTPTSHTEVVLAAKQAMHYNSLSKGIPEYRRRSRASQTSVFISPNAVHVPLCRSSTASSSSGRLSPPRSPSPGIINNNSTTSHPSVRCERPLSPPGKETYRPKVSASSMSYKSIGNNMLPSSERRVVSHPSKIGTTTPPDSRYSAPGRNQSEGKIKRTRRKASTPAATATAIPNIAFYPGGKQSDPLATLASIANLLKVANTDLSSTSHHNRLMAARDKLYKNMEKVENITPKTRRREARVQKSSRRSSNISSASSAAISSLPSPPSFSLSAEKSNNHLGDSRAMDATPSRLIPSALALASTASVPSPVSIKSQSEHHLSTSNLSDLPSDFLKTAVATLKESIVAAIAAAATSSGPQKETTLNVSTSRGDDINKSVKDDTSNEILNSRIHSSSKASASVSIPILPSGPSIIHPGSTSNLDRTGYASTSDCKASHIAVAKVSSKKNINIALSTRSTALKSSSAASSINIPVFKHIHNLFPSEAKESLPTKQLGHQFFSVVADVVGWVEGGFRTPSKQREEVSEASVKAVALPLLSIAKQDSRPKKKWMSHSHALPLQTSISSTAIMTASMLLFHVISAEANNSTATDQCGEESKAGMAVKEDSLKHQDSSYDETVLSYSKPNTTLEASINTRVIKSNEDARKGHVKAEVNDMNSTANKDVMMAAMAAMKTAEALAPLCDALRLRVTSLEAENAQLRRKLARSQEDVVASSKRSAAVMRAAARDRSLTTAASTAITTQGLAQASVQLAHAAAMAAGLGLGRSVGGGIDRRRMAERRGMVGEGKETGEKGQRANGNDSLELTRQGLYSSSFCNMPPEPLRIK
eukprot:CAMPEP_0175040812 /NCGR_PEP_ID=MMETSP0052_2-20121109/1500_1 /TAXON_ID=51329 ORGANISM="Polytomella parva, Strain SAG 63-3" /NCGR_SAMPLE_ID=MMETSP0052_2 /ASSEMBLY_ACC=CAM_ASM_000194 /LENGTH=828 /DNA_ID=CAMNT_0016303123 /DNA_START=92 /DNA_END=2578 /DNA_ORIENTATION=-